MAKLNSMVYKTFTWINNPASCSFSCDKAVAKHKYPELDGMDMEDLGANEIVLSGKGTFFGPNAYTQWMELWNVFITVGPGSFYHPVYTNVSKALMTKLQSDLERVDSVEYSFEILAYTPTSDDYSVVETLITSGTSGGGSGGQINVGDIVICNGRAKYDSYGSMPQSRLLSNERMTVTHTNYKSGATHPVHVGSTGWMALSDVQLAGSGSGSPPTPTLHKRKIHIVTDQWGQEISWEWEYYYE